METERWRSVTNYDPIIPLLASNNEAVKFFVNRDLLGKIDTKVDMLWGLPEAQKIVNQQQKDGSWIYPGGNKKVRSTENYNQIETFRQLGYLVEMFGFNKSSPSISKAVDFLFSFQTKEGDIRGILGNQYAPYYTAAMLELFSKAGYQDDSRLIKAMEWLSSIRQDDGGWAIPLRTLGRKLDAIAMAIPTLEPDRTKPSSHMVTGIVLRAYASNGAYNQSQEAQAAGALLLKSLFKADKYPDRSPADYWLKFTFPFWFTDLISAMDTLSLLGFSRAEPGIQKAIQWFIDNQQPNGLWKLKVLKNLHYDNDLWLSLAISRILKRLYTH